VSVETNLVRKWYEIVKLDNVEGKQADLDMGKEIVRGSEGNKEVSFFASKVIFELTA
jgi:hypothetical protein